MDGRSRRGVVLACNTHASEKSNMNRDETQVGIILRELQERAKELNCLYQVDELLNRPELALEEIFRGMIQVLPPGWQYPHDCQARIIFEGQAIEPPDFVRHSWVQSADIVVQGETVGRIEVSYRAQMPKFDEGPFLKEERKLIETIADRIANHIMQRRLKAAFEGLSTVTGDLANDKRRVAGCSRISARHRPGAAAAHFAQTDQSLELVWRSRGQGTVAAERSFRSRRGREPWR